MKYHARRIEYCAIEVEYQVSEAAKLLSILAGNGIDFLAYKAVPQGSARTVFTLFSENARAMHDVAVKNGFKVEGPFPAVSVIGDEEIGALAAIYGKLSRAGINVVESSGIAHINDAYGVILYLDEEDCDRAVAALGK